MGRKIEVLFTPAEFRALRDRDLSGMMCVVFDILRATSTMVTALANGATAIVPVEEIPDALELQRKFPGALLAGEREGLRIGSALTGGVEFDLGNSPREFVAGKVAGKKIISTTTNGTRALRACSSAATVAIGSFLNLRATADFIVGQRMENILIVCAGTGEQAALEDTLAAGALCEMISRNLPACALSDSAEIACRVFQSLGNDLRSAACSAANARRLLANPDLREDVEFCLQRDRFPLVALLGTDGAIRRL